MYYVNSNQIFNNETFGTWSSLNLRIIKDHLGSYIMCIGKDQINGSLYPKEMG